MKKIIVFLSILFLLTGLMALESGGPYSCDSNTVLLMHFEDNVQNSANVGYHATANGNIIYENSRDGLGKCLRINNRVASDHSYLQIPFYSELNFNDEFSIECWFKINSWNDAHTQKPALLKKYISGLADYELVINPDQSVVQANVDCIDEPQYYRNISTRTNDIIEVGKWYHIAVYFDYSQHYFYLILRDEDHNELVASRSYTFTKPHNSLGPLYLGFGNNNDSYFDGCIDELRISNSIREYRDDILADINEMTFKDSVEPLLKDKWKVYTPPFNSYYPVSSTSGEQFAGADCGETAMLRLIHYWEYPRFPEGYINYTKDNYHWTADYNNTEYYFDQMPYTFQSDPSEDDYSAAATLAMHIAAPKNYYLIGYNGRNPYIPGIFERYFLYDTKTRFVFREEYSKDEWIKIFKHELSHGRPILLCGNEERYANGGVAGHFYVCDGYNGDKFHTDLSIGSIEYWIDIDEFPYGNNQEALIFAQPAYENRSISLNYPKGNEYIQKGSTIDILWSSENISTLKLEYSSDAGKNWLLIADNIPAANQSYSWTLPELVSEGYKVRLSNKDDMNIYTRSDLFNVFDDILFDFQYPVSGNHYQSGSIQTVFWTSEGIPAFRLEYSDDETTWTTLIDSVNAIDGMVKYTVPDLNSNTVKFKAVNLADESKVFLSDIFTVSAEAGIGGAYKYLDSTVVLMHFDGDLSNVCGDPQATYSGGENYFDNYSLGLGQSFLIDNDINSSNNAMTIPYCEALDLGNHWSIELWINTKSYGTSKTEYPFILDKPDALTIGLRGDGYIRAELKFDDLYGFNISQDTTVELNKWYHIKLYSDSDEETITMEIHNAERELIFKESKDFPRSANTIKSGNDDWHIGGVAMGSNIQFDGLIDELKITRGKYVESSNVEIPSHYSLTSYPNPFNPLSNIEYDLPDADHVSIKIYDINGRLLETLVDEYKQAGHWRSIWDARGMSSGIYIYRLQTSQQVISKKMLLIK